MTIVKGTDVRERKFTIRCSELEHEYLLYVANQNREKKATYWRGKILQDFPLWEAKRMNGKI